ncbi:ADP-ribosylation/crystallin J1 [Flavobacterium oreochromis]|uniref:ADP-ribosylation/crystallin J1 n=1 Tax=Flavobacterium oreochromis TaxID=2906078 RepID=UPI001930F22A|nr:ADP-ribosylation/crystallin J1 [Flavobacterium oreochromis]
MKTIQLYRPVGLKEMELIAASNFSVFPPRLSWQPIFYPVMNLQYAEDIAKQWNAIDEFSGYCGIVTTFKVAADYIQNFEIQNVGAVHHDELWIPSEELETFNKNISGKIEMVKVFFGDLCSQDTKSKIQDFQSKLTNLKD